VPFAGTFATPFRIVMSRSCWSNEVWRSTIRRSGDGFNTMHRTRGEDSTASGVDQQISWRVDETYVRIKGRWFYLYRAIDSAGATIDFFLSAFRSADAAKALFAKALADPSHPQPRVINTDKAKCYPPAIYGSKGEGVLRKRCRHRPVQYLNNILEQDHRAIKKRIRAKQHFRQFGCARRTIQGYEVIHKIRKGQVRWVKKGDVLAQNQFIDRAFGLTA
jgi:transposase, IS6 family